MVSAAGGESIPSSTYRTNRPLPSEGTKYAFNTVVVSPPGEDEKSNRPMTFAEVRQERQAMQEKYNNYERERDHFYHQARDHPMLVKPRSKS